jgi:hypothetical protein
MCNPQKMDVFLEEYWRKLCGESFKTYRSSFIQHLNCVTKQMEELYDLDER